MSFQDYLHHANHRPAAGLPTNAAEAAGQAAYYQTLRNMEETRRQQPPGVYVPHAKTEPPRWMRHHAFKRGLAFFFGGKLCLFTLAIFFGPKPPALVTGVGYLFEGIALLGIPLMIFGVLNFFVRLRRRRTEESGETEAPPQA